MTDVPARRETTDALRRTLANTKWRRETKHGWQWQCADCLRIWMDGSPEIHDDDCDILLSQAELAAIERQREELRQGNQRLRRVLGVTANRICESVAREGQACTTMCLPLDEWCDPCMAKYALYDAARLSGSPAATEKDDAK